MNKKEIEKIVMEKLSKTIDGLNSITYQITLNYVNYKDEQQTNQELDRIQSLLESIVKTVTYGTYDIRITGSGDYLENENQKESS